MPDHSESAALSALVLANVHSAELVTKVLRSHNFDVVDTGNAMTASELCKHRRFDLGIYDGDVSGALGLAEPSGMSSLPRVAIGLLPAAGRDSAGTRLHFVVRKPIDPELFAKTVKAAFAPIACDRRLSFRHEALIDVSFCSLKHREKSRVLSGARILNLSLTGLCIQAGEMLPQEAVLETVFRLPSSNSTIQLIGKVVWSHSSGRSGVKFMNLDTSDQRKLEDWADSMSWANQNL
jgi:hypothetical protein